jgi:hypothetical protein
MAGPTGMSWTLPSGGGLELGRQFSGQSAAGASLRCPALCPLADFSAVHRARRCPASAPGWLPGTAPAELGVSNLKEKATHDYVRHGTITFFPALEVATVSPLVTGQQMGGCEKLGHHLCPSADAELGEDPS